MIITIHCKHDNNGALLTKYGECIFEATYCLMDARKIHLWQAPFGQYVDPKPPLGFISGTA